MAMNEEFVYGNGHKAMKKIDIVDRLNTVKPSHGSFRKCQDAVKEIKTLRERNESLTKRVAELEAQLSQRVAA